MNIIDELEIKQQLCIIHLRRTICAKLKCYKRRIKFTEEELDKIIKNKRFKVINNGHLGGVVAHTKN